MWLFKKRKKENDVFASGAPTPPSFEPKKCNHKWCDFDPYIKYQYTPYYKDNKLTKYGRLNIRMIETYVCCLCLEREDYELVSWNYENLTQEEAYQRVKDFKEEHKGMYKIRAEVEEKIADMIHNIDRDFLRNLAMLHPEKLGSSNLIQVPVISEFIKENNNE